MACALVWGQLATPAFAETPVPNTPAGRTLQAFLDAFNSADHAKLDAYVKTYDPGETSDALLSFSSRTGGFALLSIERNATDFINFRVKGRSDNIEAFGNLQLSSTFPPKVKTLSIRPLPPGAVIDDITLDANSRQHVIDSVSSRLTEYYVYPEIAQKMNQAIDDHQKHGDYSTITDGNQFAEALTRDLRAISHDRHLRINYDPYKPTQPDPQANSAEIAHYRIELEHNNCSFTKIEILPHNIGYLRFDEFADPGLCGPTVTAAMNFLAHVDAIIFDLRENHGGNPSMVQFIVSYLFDKPTHINDLYNRHDDTTTQYWTLPYVPGPRLIGKPAYVLTSSRTFSGAEEFAYDLQTQKRATIVGEITAGGAHPVRGMPAGDHFTIGVPLGRPINPVTKTDWEGTGIQPNVKVPASDALAAAQKLAAENPIK